MIAVDTNVLVYAHREDAVHHRLAADALTRAVGARGGCAIPWPCVHEFLAIVTHSRIYSPPTPIGPALETARTLLNDERVHVIGEGREHFDVLDRLVSEANITGARIHDARVAAICLAHGVDALWSADRDFSWFPELRVVNPLVA